MVTTVSSDWLPRVGERVSVSWGLEAVTGQVVEAYASGSRPRAVVAIDPGQISEDTVTVTLPLDALQPLAAESSWARTVIYERSLLNALERVLGEAGARVETQPSGTPDADIVMRLASGRALVVDVKAPTSVTRGSKALERAAAQLADQVGGEPEALGLLVLADAPARPLELQRSDVAVAVWRDERDDPSLADALGHLLISEGLESLNEAASVLPAITQLIEDLSERIAGAYGSVAEQEEHIGRNRKWQAQVDARVDELLRACTRLLSLLRKADAMLAYVLQRFQVPSGRAESREFLVQARLAFIEVEPMSHAVTGLADQLAVMRLHRPELHNSLSVMERALRQFYEGIQLVSSWVPRIDEVLSGPAEA